MLNLHLILLIFVLKMIITSFPLDLGRTEVNNILLRHIYFLNNSMTKKDKNFLAGEKKRSPISSDELFLPSALGVLSLWHAVAFGEAKCRLQL